MRKGGFLVQYALVIPASHRPVFGVFLSTGETYHRPILRQLKRAAAELDVRFVICGFPSSGSFAKVEELYTLEDLAGC